VISVATAAEGAYGGAKRHILGIGPGNKRSEDDMFDSRLMLPHNGMLDFDFRDV
jgi:hypothetical protein